MKLFEKRTTQVFAAATVLAVLGLLTPKAAHAVAAALVQVTNTTADPVITQGIGNQAAQMIDIACYAANPGTSQGCATVSGGGQYTPPTYAVPANQTLVITAVDVQPYYTTTPSQCAGLTSIAVTTDNFTRKVWDVTGSNTVHFEYPTGFLLSPGQVLGNSVAAGDVCAASIEMHGYLTSN